MEKEMKKKEQLNLNHQIASKEERGITLIALVVTIVVLLILAGITISLVFGSNGVIQKAQDSKEQTEIGEMREKLEMAKVPVYADGNGLYKVQDYWDRIESEGLIADKTVDIIDNGDGTYEVTTTPGYVFEITVEPNKEIAENIIIGECIGKGENLSIGIRVVKKTTNSIEIEVVRAEGASNFKYSIKKQGEEYGAAEEKSETRHVFSGLTQGGIYTIKVEATKDGEQQIVEKTVQVGEIPLAIDGDVIWTGNGQAEVRIYTNETEYQIEWQKNGIEEGNWTREASGVKEKTITGLVNGDIIYTRLYDGTSSGKYSNIEVKDITKPKIIINLNKKTGNTLVGIKAKVEQKDEESGIKLTECKWTYNSNKNTEIDETEYTQKFSKETEELNLKIDVEGTYYLHVLTVDNAGNKVQQISEEIKIEKADIEYVTDGLIVYYDAINNTGNGHANNITTWKNLVSDKYNGIIHGGVWHEEYFQTDGIDDWVDVGLIKEPNITIESVVAHGDTYNSYGISNFDSGGIGLSDYNKSGYNGLMVYTNGYKTIDSSKRYTVNKIYSLSGSYNGRTAKFFENGDKYSLEVNAPISYASNTIYALGGNPSGTSCGMFTKEKIYSIRIYNRALTDEEVLQNYNMDKAIYNFLD